MQSDEPTPGRGKILLLAAALVLASLVSGLMVSRTSIGLRRNGAHIILPGQEALLADLLGKGLELPEGCRWAGASIELSIVTSRYTCGAAERVLTLCHPSVNCGAGTVSTTAMFALAGEVPPALLEFLAARLRAGEAGFRWESEVDSSGKK